MASGTFEPLFCCGISIPIVLMPVSVPTLVLPLSNSMAFNITTIGFTIFLSLLLFNGGIDMANLRTPPLHTKNSTASMRWVVCCNDILSFLLYPTERSNVFLSCSFTHGLALYVLIFFGVYKFRKTGSWFK